MDDLITLDTLAFSQSNLLGSSVTSDNLGSDFSILFNQEFENGKQMLPEANQVLINAKSPDEFESSQIELVETDKKELEQDENLKEIVNTDIPDKEDEEIKSSLSVQNNNYFNVPIKPQEEIKQSEILNQQNNVMLENKESVNVIDNHQTSFIIPDFPAADSLENKTDFFVHPSDTNSQIQPNSISELEPVDSLVNPLLSQKPEMSEQADNKRVIEPSFVMSKEGNRSDDLENKNFIDQKNNSSFETKVKEETVSESLKPVIKVDIKSEEPTFSQLVQPEMNDKTVQTTVEPKQNQVNSTTTKEITVFQKDNITEMTSMIKKEAEFITDGKTHQFKLSLQPQNLGEVDIMLDMKDGKLTAKFLVETEKVKDLIKISLPILQETLAKQNIVVEKPSVSLNTFSESNSFQFSGSLDQRQHQQSKFSNSGKLSQQYQVNDNYEESKSIQTLDSVDILV